MGHSHDPRSPYLVYQNSGEFITVRYVDCDGFCVVIYDSMLLLDYEGNGSKTYLSCNGQFKLIGSLIGISENRSKSSVAKVVLAHPRLQPPLEPQKCTCSTVYWLQVYYSCRNTSKRSFRSLRTTPMIESPRVPESAAAANCQGKHSSFRTYMVCYLFCL
jgi:hypothetical protein